MKDFFKAGILMLVVLAVVYLAFAFIGWEFNPAYWTEVARVIFIILGGFACVSALSIYFGVP